MHRKTETVYLFTFASEAMLAVAPVALRGSDNNIETIFEKQFRFNNTSFDYIMEAKAKFAINIIPYFAQTKDLPCIQSGTPNSFPCMEQLIN